MRTYQLMTTMFLLGIGACSSQEGSMSQENPAAKNTEALTAASSARAPDPVKITVASSALAAPSTKKAAAPTALSVKQAQALTSTPPSTTSPSTAALAAASPAAYADPAQAAAASVGVLAELVASGPPGARGFTSAPEAQSSSISDGMAVQFVRLDKLVAYKSGQDPKSLLLDKQEMMYPITVAGDVRTSVTVHQRPDGNWEAAKFGNAPVAQASHSTRRSVLSKRSTDTGTVSMVEIPTVKALLLSHTEKGVLMVTPVYDIPGTAFKAGGTRTAAEVLGALQTIAANVDLTVPN